MSESAGVLSPVMDRGEYVPTGLLEKICGLMVTEVSCGRIQSFKRGPSVPVTFSRWKGFELLIGRQHGGRPGELACLALRIYPGLREKAGPMKIDRGTEVLLMEGIAERGPPLGNGGRPKALAPHRPILPFHQGLGMGLPGPGLGACDPEFAEQACHPPIDVFGAMIGMEPTKTEIPGIFTPEHGKGDGLGACQTRFQVGNGRSCVESHDGRHPSIMPESPLAVRLTS